MTDYESLEALADELYDEMEECSYCSGDGLVECVDFFQCLKKHLTNKRGRHWCECPSCRGTGNAKDQTTW